MEWVNRILKESNCQTLPLPQSRLRGAGLTGSTLRVRQFALSEGLLAKNDRIDAQLLADFGQSIGLRSTLPTRRLEKQIGELFALSRLLIEQRTALLNQLEHLHYAQLIVCSKSAQKPRAPDRTSQPETQNPHRPRHPKRSTDRTPLLD